MGAVRRGYVTQAGSAPALSYWDALVQTQTVSPPLLGGFNASGRFSGVLSALPQQAQVAILSEQYAGGGFPVATVALTQTPALLPALNSQETAIYGPRGEVLSYATASGPTILYRNAAGTLSITVDPATNKVLMAASGGVWINGQEVAVP